MSRNSLAFFAFIGSFVLLIMHPTAVTGLAASSGPNFLTKMILRIGGGKALREEVVKRYFDGVNKKNDEQIRSCFDPAGTNIRDVCGINSTFRKATPDQLADRCMEFLAAHPDCVVKYHHGPLCGRGRSKWVLAHWYEEGSWSGSSCGIEPKGTPLTVEGQTRFLVSDELTISDMVVTRTFSDWEIQLQESKK